MLNTFLETQDLKKSFGTRNEPCVVLDGLSWKVNQGEIHGLVGENGAGKSTLMNLLTRKIEADSGKIHIRTEKIGMVHQHFQLANQLRVIDHLLLSELGRTKNRWGGLQEEKFKEQFQKELAENEVHLPIDQLVGDLSVAQRQHLEIFKALRFKPELLILDEPTAVLNPLETEHLFQKLRSLKSQGLTIIFISHKLKEVSALCDRISVIRKGRIEGTYDKDAVSLEEIGEKMVGRALHAIETSDRRHYQTSVKGQFEFPFEDRTFKGGKIYGFAGVSENGQEEYIQRIIQKLQDAQSGIKRGYIPSDRLRQAALPDLKAVENFFLPISHQKTGWLDWNEISKDFLSETQGFDLRPANPDLPLFQFSGGNQQKIVVARECRNQPQILIASEPTRGVDLGAIEKIHSAFFDLREKGTCLLLFSSDLDEVLQLSDEVSVFHKHQLSSPVQKQDLTRERLGRMMGGLQ